VPSHDDVVHAASIEFLRTTTYVSGEGMIRRLEVQDRAFPWVLKIWSRASARFCSR
jgi:hypothetical protein